ncbi:MAG: hypothetical protein WCR67_01125 [Bacilli bacterium]
MENLKTNKKPVIQYGMLLGGLILMLVLSLLPYSVIDYDGKLKTGLGFFNAVLNLDGNDISTVYRVLTIAGMTILDFVFIIAAILAVIFAIIDLVKTLKTKDFESRLDYMKENYFKALVPGVMAVVINAILGSDIAVFAVIIMAIALLIPSACVLLNGEMDKKRIIKTTAIAFVGVFAFLMTLAVSKECSLDTALHSRYDIVTHLSAWVNIILGIVTVFAVHSQKYLVRDEENPSMYTKVVLLITTVITLLALIFGAVSGLVTTGGIVVLVVGLLLIGSVTCKYWIPAFQKNDNQPLAA